jgi:Domain of unknown function (DUF5710)
MINTALRVPRGDAELVERLGAVWDATKAQWYVPEGRDPAPFDRWLPREIPDAGVRLPVNVLLLPDYCYRCGGSTAPVAGIWLEHDLLDGYEYGMLEEAGGWFLLYDETSADAIAEACSDDVLAAHGAGPLRWRTTRVCPDGYLANTCVQCTTVLGNWPLHEALVEYKAEGGDLRDLPNMPSELREASLDRLGSLAD